MALTGFICLKQGRILRTNSKSILTPNSPTHFSISSLTLLLEPSARRGLVRSISMAPEPDDSLTEDERRALRGSKFAPLPPPAPPSFSRSNPRLAHPGGPVKTNKAAALAKFLERKLQQPDGLKSINPDLVELAVKNAKETVKASSVPSTSRRNVRHVASFEDSSESSGDDEEEAAIIDNKKRKKEKTKDSSDIEEPGKETKKRQKKKKKKDKKMKKEGKMRKKSKS